MFESQGFVFFIALLAVAEVFGQATKPAPLAPQRAIKLAQNGRCEEALPALKRASQPGTDKTDKAHGSVCGCTVRHVDQSNRRSGRLPADTEPRISQRSEVLFLSVHTYSDLSTKAAQQLAMTAPNSIEGHKLDAEALEAPALRKARSPHPQAEHVP